MNEKLTIQEREILHSDFPDDGVEYDRATIEKFSPDVRSVRLATGRYYTPAEMRERAKKAFSVKLYK